MAETNLPHNHARTILRTLKVTPQGEAPFLLIELVINCPHCGEIAVAFGGHHVGALIENLQAAQRDYPDLTELPVIDKQQHSWSATVDPSKTKYN